MGKGFLASGLVLFILGAVFCFYVLLPWLFACLVNYTPNNIHLMLDAADAISLTFQLMVVFGLCFQLPLICVLLEKMGWVRLTQLKQARRYVIVLAFIVGMLLAPPDVLSQTLIALPLYGLFELGLFWVQLMAKRRLEDEP